MSSHAALLYAKLLVLERCHIGCTMKTEPQPERQEKVASTTLPAPSSETQSEEGTCCKVKEFLSIILSSANQEFLGGYCIKQYEEVAGVISTYFALQM